MADRYEELLQQISQQLKTYSVKGWPETLERWIEELHVADTDMRSHLERTKNSTGGMGSLGDIFICPQAGDDIPNDPTAIKAANADFKHLIGELYALVTQRLNHLN